MLTLPTDLRDAFKEPLGPVYTDVDTLLADVDAAREAHAAPGAPLVAVGDVVTYHLRQAGREPDVALIDGKTEREEVAVEIRRALEGAGDRRVVVENPAGELSLKLLEALGEAFAEQREDDDDAGRDGDDAGRDGDDAGRETVLIEVIGEEDLAALPAIVAAPIGSSVVYGQPGEGMVRVEVTPEQVDDARALFRAMDGDVAAALAALGVATE